MVGEFTFVDIFASKDVDYLLAIISLMILIPFWKLLSGGTKKLVKNEKLYSVSTKRKKK